MPPKKRQPPSRRSGAVARREGGRTGARLPGLVLAALLVTWSAAPAWSGPITALAFTPDSSVLASSGVRSIDLRSPADGSVQDRVRCNLPKIMSLAFHPRGRILAVAGGDPGVRGEVVLLDWRQQTILHHLTNPGDLATSVSFNHDGTLLGVAGADHIARVWRLGRDGSTVAEALSLTGHAGPVLVLAFSPTGRTAVTGSADRSIKVWSAEDSRLLRTFTHHTDIVHALVFRPLGREFTETFAPESHEPPLSRPTGTLSPSVPTGRGAESPPAFCASAAADRTVRIWQPEIGRMVRIIRGHNGPIFALAYSRDGQTLFSAGKEGIIRRLDADSDAILEEWHAHDDWIYALAVSPDGLKLASGDWAGAVRILDLNPAKRLDHRREPKSP